MHLYFVRHAESVANVPGLKEQVGSGDQLTPKGFRQAEALARNLAGFRFDRVYVSPKLRTIQTIAPYLLANRRKAVLLPISAEIRSIEFGQPAPRREPKPCRIPPEYLDLVTQESEHDFTLFQKETVGEGASRTMKLARYLRMRYAGTEASVLLVSHGTIGWLLFTILLETGGCGMKLESMRDTLAHLAETQRIGNAELWCLAERLGTFSIVSRTGAPTDR